MNHMEIDANILVESHPEVYPPSDDSYLLIRSFNVFPEERILEIGCGSGIVSLHCARNGGIVTCGDINPHAVELTKKNTELNNIELCVKNTDVYSNIDGNYDTIIFNLPYLPVQEEGELAKAWSGGEGGIGPLPELINQSSKYLNKDGRIIVVISSLMDRNIINKILSGYSVNKLSELPLFFEKLEVLEIKLN